MSFRVLAAGMVVLGIGVMPLETSARSGGFTAAPMLGARIAGRPFVATPFAHAFRPQRISGAFSPLREGERRGDGFPSWWGDASYLPGYYPYGEFPYPYQPSEDVSERSRPILPYQPGCHTETKKVPSEAGGERSINITRCY
jgi:hypothetical protein